MNSDLSRLDALRLLQALETDERKPALVWLWKAPDRTKTTIRRAQ